MPPSGAPGETSPNPSADTPPVPSPPPPPPRFEVILYPTWVPASPRIGGWSEETPEPARPPGRGDAGPHVGAGITSNRGMVGRDPARPTLPGVEVILNPMWLTASPRIGG
ncbi:hypothetical protein GCM10009826_35460 [Humibacillus xanthopallidus]